MRELRLLFFCVLCGVLILFGAVQPVRSSANDENENTTVRRIDRLALVRRHNIRLSRPDPLTPLDMSAAYISEDGGKNWQHIGRKGRQTFGGYFHPKRTGWIYMTLTEGAPGAGLWLTRDNGRTWEAFDDLPFSNIQRVVFDPSNDALMYVTTFGGSVWRGPVTPDKE